MAFESGRYFNKVSINLTSGFSAGNQLFELGIISNVNTRYSTGIQIAGLANVVGSNSYLNLPVSRQDSLRKAGFVPGFKGIQFSGILNFSRNDVTGFQFSGGLNMNQGNARVIQIAGIGNFVGMGSFGFQLGGLFNVNQRGVSGLQLSMLYNNARGVLSGIQFGAFNFSKKNDAVRIPTASKIGSSGAQIGLINIASKAMDGLQVRLINHSKGFRGVQIGLINIHKKGPYPGESNKYGIPIGLINIGSLPKVKAFTDDLYLLSFALFSSNCTNCSWTKSQMPIEGRFLKTIENELIFQYNPDTSLDQPSKISIGYGFQRVLYNKSSSIAADPANKRYFFSYGMRIINNYFNSKIKREANISTKAMLEVGHRFLWAYFFGGLSLNAILLDSPLENRSLFLTSGNLNGLNYRLSLGYSLGIRL